MGFGGFLFGTEAPAPYYWGEIDAKVNWCEADYVVSPHVAEFWNTLSSLPMFVLGLTGAYLEAKHATGERRFLIMFLLLALVGLGSAAFHGTLRWHWELLDELPMLWTNHALVYAQICVRDPPGSPTRWRVILAILASAVGVSAAYVIYEMYVIFFVFYGLGVAAMYGFLFVERYRYGKLRADFKKHFIICAAVYNGAFLLWNLEHIYCDIVQPFNFHALWHLGAGYATYLYMFWLVGSRCRALLAMSKKKVDCSQEGSVTFERLGGFLPHYIKLVPHA